MPLIFTYILDNDKDPIPCDCCQSPDVELAEIPTHVRSYQKRAGRDTKRLCRLCAGSMAGVMWEFADQNPGSNIAGVICNVGNAILKVLKERNTV